MAVTADHLYGDPVVSILIPVLDRVDNAARVVNSIRASSTVDVEIVFLCSPNDLDERHACEETGERVVTVTWEPGRGDYARKCNAGFHLTRGEWVLLAADDVIFHERWDTEALACAEQTAARFVGTNDGGGNPLVRKGQHSTHSLIRRDYITEVGATFDDGPGVVLHEGYSHQWVDMEAVHAARARGEWAFAAGSLLEHLHPFFDSRIERDSTYQRGLDSGNARTDQRAFVLRRRRFDAIGKGRR